MELLTTALPSSTTETSIVELASWPGRMVIEGFYPSTAQSPAAVMVTVYGNGFHQLDTLTCKFGERKGLSRASLLSSTAIRCLSRTQNPGNATLSLSYNDRDWVKAPSPFLSISRASTIRITPTFGSINGGTMVTVWGEAVKKAGMQHCVFGTSNVKMIISGSVGLYGVGRTLALAASTAHMESKLPYRRSTTSQLRNRVFLATFAVLALRLPMDKAHVRAVFTVPPMLLVSSRRVDQERFARRWQMKSRCTASLEPPTAYMDKLSA